MTPAMLRQQQEYVKAYREAKKNYSPIYDLPKLHPEPDYIIKTRPPMWDDWRLNIFRGIKENRHKMEANKLARRKCWKTGGLLESCMEKESMWRPGRCRPQFDAFLQCCYHEQQVELDKIRRDTKIHSEWYWLNLYDEDGEIGKQAEWEPETQLTKIWSSMLYNMVFKPDKQGGVTKEQREQRLDELRKKQGIDMYHIKEEFEYDFHLDENAAIRLNGGVDKTIYNV